MAQGALLGKAGRGQHRQAAADGLVDGLAKFGVEFGRPTFLLLAYSAEWRWLTDRDDSPWYPSMRLVRQSVAGDWREPVARVAAALTGATAGPPKGGAVR